MSIRDQVKQIAREVILANGGAGKYRLGTVSSLNDNGSCNVMIDGNAVVATPLYPVVIGQQAAVIFGTGGVISAVPLRPKPDDVVFEHPPFFTGGGSRVAWQERNLTTSPVSYAIRYQQIGSNQIFRWPIALGSGNAPYVLPNTISFSPDGTKSIYGGGPMVWNTQTQGALPPGLKTKIAVVPLGRNLTTAGAIPGFIRGFFLGATEGLTVFPAGFDLVASVFPAPVNTFQTYTYRIQDVYVSNDGTQIFWTEFLALQDVTPSVSNLEYNLLTLCTLVGGVRTVLGALIPYTNSVGIVGSGLGGVISSTAGRPVVGLVAFVWDVVREYCLANRPFNFPTSFGNPVDGSRDLVDFFVLNANFGNTVPPIILETDVGNSPDTNIPSQGVSQITYSRNHTAALNTTFISFTANSNPSFIFSEDLSAGTFKKYALLANDGTNPTGLLLSMFGESDQQRGIFRNDPSNVNAVILKKVKTNEAALQVVIQLDNFILTPSPVDAGLTQFNLRTTAYDNFIIVPNVLNGGPLAWGLV